jgi:segregation and condensation protein A
MTPMVTQLATRYDLPEDQLSLFTGFEVRIAIFAGPTDLLLHLVRRRQVEIAEVNIADITRQYLSYLETLSDLNIELAAEFIVVAAHLIYLKSRMLLPLQDDEDEDGEDMDLDPQAELARRLEEYRAYRDAAELLDESRKLRNKLFLRSTDEDQIGTGLIELSDVSIFDMVAAVGELLSRATPSPPRVVQRRTVTVSERLPEILTELHAAGKSGVRFTQLVDMPASRVYIIVTFLAILELIRRGRVVVGPVEGHGNFTVRLAHTMNDSA